MESRGFRPIIIIIVADIETDLRVIIVIVFSFKSRVLKIGVVEVLAADLDKGDIIVL
jgi:hypothetical protein